MAEWSSPSSGHILTVLSHPALARNFPSGEKAAQRAGWACPARGNFSAQSPAERTEMFFAVVAKANAALSGENAVAVMKAPHSAL